MVLLKEGKNEPNEKRTTDIELLTLSQHLQILPIPHITIHNPLKSPIPNPEMGKEQQTMPVHERQPRQPEMWLLKTNGRNHQILRARKLQIHQRPRQCSHPKINLCVQ